MRTVINFVHIRRVPRKQILLVKKKETWILPGGKPELGERDYDCLRRECAEELPKVKNLVVNGLLGCFEGQTPHTGDEIIAKVYFADLDGDIKPGAEISDARYFYRESLKELAVSKITKKIITKLIAQHHL